MTVYCPNCGKPNTNEAQSCASCGTQLKQQKKAGASKFKGTMMMNNMAAPPAPAAPAAPPPAAAPGGPVQAGAPKAKKDMAFQATMLGPMTPPPGAAPPAISPPSGGGFGAPPAAAPPAAATPAPGGFGAPPAAAPPAAAPPAAATPAPGGFGAPPAAATPAPGGFGAPPDAAPAAGGFGAPPDAAPAPGGFGAATPAPLDQGFGSAPTDQPPAAGGFGAPTPAPGGFGAAPPAGAPAGGFGAGGGAPPNAGGSAPASGGGKKKIIIGVGVGCLLLILIACGVGGYLYYRAKQAVEGMQSFAQDAPAEIQRISLGLQLVAIKSECASDSSGNASAARFHPQVMAQVQGSICQVTQDTIDAFADNNRSEAHTMVGQPEAATAASFGADVSQCYIYTSGSARIGACNFPDGSFKFITFQNPGAVQ